MDDIGPGSHEHVSLCQNGHNVFMASDGSSRYGMATIGEDFYGRVSASSSFNFGLHGTNSIQVAILSYHFPVLANIYLFCFSHLLYGKSTIMRNCLLAFVPCSPV